MNRDDPAADRILALTLKIGAYSAFVLVVAGLCLQGFLGRGKVVTATGVVVLLATPVLRVVVAGIQFLRERDLKFALVSLGVLGIIVLAYFLGIQA